MVAMILSTARKLALKIASYGLMHLAVAILVAFAGASSVRARMHGDHRRDGAAA